MPSRSTRSGAATAGAAAAAAAASRSGSPRRPFGSGSNGGRPPACSAIRYGPGGAREAHLELDAVVDRVVGAQRQEVEVLAVRVERGRVVAELGIGDERAAVRRDLVQLDRHVPGAGGEGVGEPGAVGRPGEVVAATVDAGVDGVELAAGDVADPDLVAMVGEGDPAALRRGAHPGDVAGVPGQDLGLVAGERDHPLLARGVAHRDQGAAVGQPLAMAHAAGIAAAVAARRALPERHAEQLAAGDQRQRVAGRMEAERFQVLAGGDELARRLGAVRGRADVELAVAVARRVEQADLRAALVDDALAVGLRVAGVERLVVGVPAQLAAVGPAGVEVADAVAVAEEPDAAGDPHRAGEVAGQLLHAPEAAAAFGVDPERARGAAAIALPARRVGGVAADHLALAGTEGEVVDLAPGQRPRRAAGGADDEGVVVAEEGLALGGDVDDLARRRPAAHQRVGAQPGEAPRRAALGRHDIDLGMLLVAADEGEQLAVGRKAGRGRLREARGQAPGDAAGGAHRPQVVVGDEHDRLAVEGRMAHVRRQVLVHVVSRSRWMRCRAGSSR